MAKVSEGRVAMNASFDSTKVAARERAAALEAARVRAEIADGKADPNALALQRRRDAQKNIDPNRRRGGDAAKLSATEAERRVRIVPADKARYRALVRMDRDVPEAALRAAIEDEGYRVVSVSPRVSSL